uniref:MADF domain-containing protein n=1 Tax=Angiostrongylus cantonensis TaxID=6313 RepID=A0A0K0DKK3_ANGCA
MSYPAKILLIKLVKQHESIWNTRSQYYARSDMKTQAWNEIAEKMQAHGFESKVGRLKVMWKNLRDQWKRNLALKMPPEREWYFQRRINFLAGTYEDGELAHCPQTSDASPEIQEAPDDTLYDVKVDAFEYFENGYAIGGSSFTDDISNGAKREPKSEMKDDGATYEQASVMVFSENDISEMPEKSSNLPNSAVASSSVQGDNTNAAPPPAKRMRVDTRSGGVSIKPPKDATNGQIRVHNGKEHADKYDKYAAFVSTALREMPEIEAKRRMREMTMLLLEDVDFKV